MITTAREYQVAQKHLERFTATLSELCARPIGDSNEELRSMLAGREGLESLLIDIKLEIEEYEYLTQTPNPIIKISSFRDIGKSLVKGRLAKKYSREELAEILGMTEKQVRQQEEDHYFAIEHKRLHELIEILDLNIPKNVTIPCEEQSLSRIIEKLKQVGLTEKFVKQRLIPAKDRPLINDELNVPGNSQLTVVGKLIETLGHVFDWKPHQIFSDERLRVSRSNIPGFTDIIEDEADRITEQLYATYILNLAKAVADSPSQSNHDTKTVPADSVKKSVIDTYGDFTVGSVTKYVWDCGISVLPIQDDVPFQAAYLSNDNGKVIVLNIRSRQSGKSLFALLKFFYIATNNVGQGNSSVIEFGNRLIGGIEAQHELDAAQFATKILLDGREEELIEHCLSIVDGDMSALRGVVPAVAGKENIPVDYLAIGCASELSKRGVDWWNEASSVIGTTENPFNECVTVFFERFSFLVDNIIDNYLLQSALEEPRLTKKDKKHWREFFQKFITPTDCLSLVSDLKQKIGDNFHIQSGLEFAREAWILGTYGSKTQADEVRLYPESYFDGEVRNGDHCLRVEITEIQDENRRRGDEYRQRVQDLEHITEDWAEDALKSFPDHFRKCLNKKLNKDYPKDVGLLIYLNTLLTLFYKSEIRQILDEEVKRALSKFTFVDILLGDDIIRY